MDFQLAAEVEEWGTCSRWGTWSLIGSSRLNPTVMIDACNLLSNHGTWPAICWVNDWKPYYLVIDRQSDHPSDHFNDISLLFYGCLGDQQLLIRTDWLTSLMALSPLLQTPTDWHISLYALRNPPLTSVPNSPPLSLAPSLNLSVSPSELLSLK